MNHTAHKTIEEYGMLNRGDAVVAAVSGGADSVALLDYLCARIDLQLKITVCHVNHCLRGEESERDEAFVRTMCSQYGIPLEVYRVDILALAGERGTSTEETAREERYRIFAQLAQEKRAKVATAHTLSDVVETVIFNMARGTGITGFCGIPPVRDYIIRPLIDCTREQVEAYCYAHSLCYMIDSTNFSDAYTRNHIRMNIVPQMYRISSDAPGAISRMTGLLRQDADYLAQQTKTLYETLFESGGIDAAQLHALHPAMRSRVIALLLSEHGIERSAHRIALIEQMLVGNAPQVLQVGKYCSIAVKNGKLVVLRTEAKKSAPVQPQNLQKESLDGQQVAANQEKTVRFCVINRQEYEKIKNNVEIDLKNVIDYDKISSDILLRTRGPQDRIRQSGRGLSKTLKKLMNELDLDDRDALLVFSDAAGVFFVEGIGPDERVCISSESKRFLYLEIKS